MLEYDTSIATKIGVGRGDFVQSGIHQSRLVLRRVALFVFSSRGNKTMSSTPRGELVVSGSGVRREADGKYTR